MSNTQTARQTHYFATSVLNVVNGIKQSIATVAAAAKYLLADFDGAWINNTNGGLKYASRTVTVTTTAAAAAYAVGAGNPIVVTGMRGGTQITESLQLTNAGGGETIRGLKAFDQITEIDIPAQPGTTGHFQFGVGDLCNPSQSSTVCSWFKPDADGFVRCRYDENGDRDDSLPVKANAIEWVGPRRILTDQTLSNPTGVGVTLYCDA